MFRLGCFVQPKLCWDSYIKIEWHVTLWQEVRRALKHISPGLLCRKLGITQYQMRLHCGFIRKQFEPSCDDKFIEIVPENKKASLSQIVTARASLK